MDTSDNDNEEPQTPQRRRSLSVPCRNEEDANVETVVTKAKRAASYLWILLHAQNCRLGANRCSRTGCADAKLVHLHLKTCPAQQDFPCPTRHNGCLQARKLLAHYRRCRQIRARQVGQAPSAAKSQHVCLICSMVARQARSLLDANAQKISPPSSGPAAVHKKSSNTNLNNRQVVSSFTVSASIQPGVLHPKSKSGSHTPPPPMFSSITLSSSGGDNSPTMPIFPTKQSRPEADWGMPPPAPRAPHSAPTSPLEAEKPEIQGKSGSFPRPLPSLTRKRSGSLDEPSLSLSAHGRGVRFAPRPEFWEGNDPDEPTTNDSLVAVEMEGSSSGVDKEEVLPVSPSRPRSASCHVFSASGPSDTCGTIYEEAGPTDTPDVHE